MQPGILKWLVGANNIAYTEKLVLIILWLFQDDEGECCPSGAEIARASSLSRATVTRALGKLTEKGIITKSHRYNKEGHKSNSYEIVPQLPLKRLAYAQREAMSGSQRGTHSLTKRQSKKPKIEEREGTPISVYNELVKKVLEEMEREGE